MTAATLTPIETVIVNEANTYGVDPRLALAIAQEESGLNPTRVGDYGTSYGLYQLHQGGELGSLTPAQAFDPTTNASVALSEVAKVEAANPGADPGAVAAAAQRPKDPTAYATAVDAIYTSASYFPDVPAGTQAATLTKYNPVVGAIVGSVPVVGPALQAGLGLVTGGLSSVTKGALSVGLTIVFTLAGLGLIALGLARLFPGVTTAVTRTLPLAL